MGDHTLRRILQIVVVVAVLAVPAWVYNSVVSRHEAVDAAWSQVESTYQRRADLIPNLQRSVERYLEHERDTLEAVTAEREGEPALDELLATLKQSRARSADALSEAAPGDAAALARIQSTQGELGAVVQRLMARSEAYPDLRSGDQFLRLQAQLEGTENRINLARSRYNEAVRRYNSTIRRLPGRLIADIEGYEARAYFESEAGADRPVALDL